MADARGSGPRERKLMGVQIPPSAPNRDTMATGHAMAEISEYLSTQEASAQFGLSDGQLRRLLISGRVEGLKKGRDWLVAASSVKQYMANRPRPGLKLGQKISRPRKMATQNRILA